MRVQVAADGGEFVGEGVNAFECGHGDDPLIVARRC
jgi:hypothetical protein